MPKQTFLRQKNMAKTWSKYFSVITISNGKYPK